MKHIKSALFLIICLAVGFGFGKLIMHYHGRGSETSSASAGMSPPLRGFFLPAETDATAFDAFPPVHATAVAVQYSADAGALALMVRHAHSLGLKVIILPPMVAREGDPYSQPLADVAAAAQNAKADVLCISWLSTDPDPAYWLPQIAGVRKAYAGKLILGATSNILPGIEFFDQVDFMGAIGPFDLPLRKTGDHGLSLHDFQTAWACYLDSIESISNRYGKKTILFDSISPPPALTDSVHSQSVIDAASEALRYEALITETKGRNGIGGVFLPWSPASDPKLPSADTFAANHDPELVTRISDLWFRAAPATKTVKAPADDADDTDTDADDTNP